MTLRSLDPAHHALERLVIHPSGPLLRPPHRRRTPRPGPAAIEQPNSPVDRCWGTDFDRSHASRQLGANGAGSGPARPRARPRAAAPRARELARLCAPPSGRDCSNAGRTLVAEAGAATAARRSHAAARSASARGAGADAPRGVLLPLHFQGRSSVKGRWGVWVLEMPRSLRWGRHVRQGLRD